MDNLGTAVIVKFTNKHLSSKNVIWKLVFNKLVRFLGVMFLNIALNILIVRYSSFSKQSKPCENVLN